MKCKGWGALGHSSSQQRVKVLAQAYKAAIGRLEQPSLRKSSIQLFCALSLRKYGAGPRPGGRAFRIFELWFPNFSGGNMKAILLWMGFLTLASVAPEPAIYKGSEGQVRFVSDAPLELIQASSNDLSGLVDTKKNSFAFLVKTRGFEGFNSPLQQEHFHENYLESARFPSASFTGKFIEDISELPEGKHQIRAKGRLKIHGQTVERIIKCQLLWAPPRMEVESQFTILLVDHQITIPQVVNQKIAEEVRVEVSLKMAQQ